MWKQVEVTELTSVDMLSFSSRMIPRFVTMAEGVGVGSRSGGHQVESNGEVFFLKITYSVLSELSFRQLDFIHVATSVMQVVKLF